MRFAVIDLLALTLLTCLAVAIFVKRQAITATEADLATMRAETERAAAEYQQKGAEIESLTRTIDRRATDFERLSRTVDGIAQLFNQAVLPTVELDPQDGIVSTRSIPTYSRADEFRDRKLVYVPDDLTYELRMSFVDRDGNVGCYEDFDEPDTFSVPLVLGENLIEVFFDGFRVPNTFRLTNHTNGASIQTLSKHVHGGGTSFSVGQGNYNQENFPLRDKLPKVFVAYVGPNSRIEVQMVESPNP